MCTVCKLISILNVWMLCYTGNVQTFTAPLATTYRLEVWGAQGGGWGGHTNSPGGYAGGWKTFTKDQKYYVVVGGKGKDRNHYTDGTSYNGGGLSLKGDYGGGGATHIATSTGVLKDLVNNKSSVICVAGGGAANGGWATEDHSKYQSGGGLVGLGSPTFYYRYIDNQYPKTETVNTKGDTGGTQTGCGPDGIKGGFGYGGSATVDYAGCGGGGWYGGNASGGGEVSSQTHGGGGSGYIGGLTNGTFKTGVRSGHGYAVISWHPNI